MTKEEKEILLTCASELAHLHMLYAGLNSMISNERHDLLCEELSQKIYRLVDTEVCKEYSRIEEAVEAA